MSTSTKKFWNIKANIKRSGTKEHLVKIGVATQTESRIACTIETIPLNWDGEFFMFENDMKEDS